MQDSFLSYSCHSGTYLTLLVNIQDPLSNNNSLGTSQKIGITQNAVKSYIDTGLGTKENTITAGTTSQYWRGDKSWVDLAIDVRNSVLTGINTALTGIVVATDTVLQAIGKLQKQATDLFTNITEVIDSNTQNYSEIYNYYNNRELIKDTIIQENLTLYNRQFPDSSVFENITTTNAAVRLVADTLSVPYNLFTSNVTFPIISDTFG